MIMHNKSDQTVRNRVHRFSNMDDSQQNQNTYDFVPKSDYKKWHLENKCLLHNQFLEGEKCGTRKGHPLSCDICSRLEEKFKSKTDGNTSNKKSGDWKCDDKLVEHSLESIVQEPTITEWKLKNPYSISDFNRSKRYNWNRHSFSSGDEFPSNLLRDLYSKDNCHEDPLETETKKNFLYNCREYLVNYQESYGVPRTEYSFSALISTMGQATGRSLLALLYVMLNIIPVVEVFLYLLRFVLDKVISIRNSKDFRQTMTRCLIFATELFSVYICLIFIFGFIVLPIVHMVIDIVAKIMLYN